MDYGGGGGGGGAKCMLALPLKLLGGGSGGWPPCHPSSYAYVCQPIKANQVDFNLIILHVFPI